MYSPLQWRHCGISSTMVPLPLTWMLLKRRSHIYAVFLCLSGSQHSTYYPGGIWHREKGDVDGANEHSKMAQSPHWTDRSLGSSWVLLSQHPPWEHTERKCLLLWAPPLSPQIYSSWVSLWPFPDNKPSPLNYDTVVQKNRKEQSSQICAFL